MMTLENTPEKFFHPAHSRDAIAEFVALLLKWNQRVNLIGAKTENDIMMRHVADAEQLANYIPNKNAIITDIGSGAGFPGMILALMGYENTHLVESDMRKCAFLTEAARACNAQVKIHNARIENLTPWKTNIITARAFAPLEKLLDLTARFLCNDTKILLLKGAQAKEEIAKAQEAWSFDCEIYASKTDARGCVMELANVTHREGK